MLENTLDNGLHVVHITKGAEGGKMAGISSINTSTLQNDFCSKMRVTDSICGNCYAASLSKMRPTMEQAITKNHFLATRDILQRELPIINARYFRFHSIGELINSQHFENLLAIVENNPLTTFSLWTKRKDIINKVLKNRAKPLNFILIYSSIELNKQAKKPRHFDKVFTVYIKKTATDQQKAAINCNSKCMDCLLCYSHNDVINVNEFRK